MEYSFKTPDPAWAPMLGLTIAFIILKLTGVITWNWLWVLSPIWLPFAAVMAALLLMIIFICIIGGILLISILLSWNR
jgi:hypothetical protein